MLSWCLKTGFDCIKKTIPVTKNFIACVPANTHALFMRLTLVPADQKIGGQFLTPEKKCECVTNRGLLQKVPKIKHFCYLLGCSKKEEAKDCKKYDRFSC